MLLLEAQKCTFGDSLSCINLFHAYFVSFISYSLPCLIHIQGWFIVEDGLEMRFERKDDVQILMKRMQVSKATGWRCVLKTVLAFHFYNQVSKKKKPVSFVDPHSICHTNTHIIFSHSTLVPLGNVFLALALFPFPLSLLNLLFFLLLFLPSSLHFQYFCSSLSSSFYYVPCCSIATYIFLTCFRLKWHHMMGMKQKKM